MEFFDTLLSHLSGSATALLGAVIGGLFSLKATDKAIRQENAKDLRREEKEVQNLLDALGVEMNALWSFHQRRIGEIIEQLPAGQALEFYYPLSQDYFTIYNANATLIGRVKDADLREIIVVCYNKCKKAVDGFKYNNMLFRDYRELLLMPPNSPNHHDYVQAKYQELIEFSSVIKEDHYELKAYVERFLQLLTTNNKP